MRLARDGRWQSAVLVTAVGLVFCLVGTDPSSGGPGDIPAIPTIPDTVRISEWHCLGPFSVGPREGITGLDDAPDDLVPSGADLPPAGARYPSMLAQGGFVTWKAFSPDSSGWVTVKFDSVLWDTLAAIYGAPGVVNVAYAFAQFESPVEARALVIAENIGSFYINGVQHLGDPYRHNYVTVPVILKQGSNRVLLRLSGYGDPSFKFELVPAPSPLVILDDYTAPDIVRGERGRFWAGVPVVNTTSSRIARATLTIGDGTTVARSSRVIENLTALCVKKVPVEIEVTQPVSQGDTIRVPIEIACDQSEAGGGTFSDTLALRIREPGQSLKRTFISRIDCSCQYYAVLPPTGYNPATDSLCALVFTLHGAGVRAEGQADAYKPKPWAFIVAPTNRRPYGFDWQDWGRLDALEVLDNATASYPIDPDRVYLTGHSMGGHGVWHVGTAHPDLFAAMGPGAGWTSFGLYIPWFLQKSSIFAEPAQIEVRDAALREDQPLAFVDNLSNVPVFIFQGGADDNVPPTHARMFASRLDDLGYTYRYKEIPGKGHWWGIDSLGTSCVDDPDLWEFFKGLRRDPCPAHIVFKTANLARSNRAYWLSINRQEALFRESRIEAAVVEGPGTGAESHTLRIVTENVDEFTVSPCAALFGEGRLVVTIDGQAQTLPDAPDQPLVFAKRAGAFRLGATRYDGLNKQPGCYGPVKQAYFSPFVLVYGTSGDAAITEMLLDQARLEAWEWWLRGNGFAEVLPDSEVTGEIIEAYNLILFGGAAENRVTKAIDRQLPIRMVDGRFRLAAQWLDDRPAGDRATAAEFVYPNPLNPERLVVVHEGTGTEGLRLSTFFGVLHSAAGLPDYLIFDDTVRKSGWAGVRAAGFFDSAWRLTPSTTRGGCSTLAP
jgi:dienelactone hydrolase